MNFEKVLHRTISLIVTGSALSVLLATTPLQAAEKLQNLDAIWNAADISNTTAKKTKKPATKVTQKKVAPSKAKYTREQYQARFKKEQALQKKRLQIAAKNKTTPKAKSVAQIPKSKLDRQRAAWKAMWEAQQKEKKLAQAKPQKIFDHKKPAAVKSTKPQIVAKAAPVKPVWNKKAAQKAPQKLTHAQYQLRWKQAQQKKNNTHAPVAKPSYASFRKSNQKASFQRLPADIVSKFRASGTREYGVSAYAQDVNSPKPLLAYQEKTARVPASVMKIITGYAALGTLGQNYRWPLDVYTNGRVHNGTLQGDLIIKGYGSPEFKTADLRKVLQGIKQKGIRNVNGRVVFDSTYFNIPNQYAFDGKTQSKYNAQPDALLFNERVNTFQIRAVGKKVRVTTTTPTHNLKIVNRMRKSSRGCRPRISISKRAGQTIATFSGRFSRRCGTRAYSRVISRPAEMIYGSMQAMWKRDVGGKLNTRFAMGRAPTNAQPLLRTYSRTLAEILPTIIKKSNNVMARQLLLTIGAKKGGQGTPRAGANAIGQWLASRGLHFPELRIENGSGLSRTARISAAHVTDLLIDAYRSPYRHVFMKSLAVAGVDGTMKGRFKRTQVQGRGFFKTGTLRDVRAIAGYVKAADGKTYAMAILHNDPRARKRALRAHDKLIEWVYAGGRSNRHVAMR
jgi:D-alanyl-D-alanine carboxypeptidase/D-alanyl-D-alanine-endopeptidase (penicillin-binding protein 4)